VASKVIEARPWTGLGSKGWENQYGELIQQYPYREFPPYNWISPQPHNLVLDALVKGGIPMLLAVSAFVLWPLIAAWRLIRMQNVWGLSMLGASAFLLLFSTIDDPLWADDMVPLFALVYAVALYLLPASRSK